MMPSIKLGEELKIARVPPECIRAGEVIVFKRHVLIAHRVVGRTRAFGRLYFIARGDRCPYVDSPVIEGIVEGLVAGKYAAVKLPIRHRLLFPALVLWHVWAGRVLRGRAFRKMNALARRVASLGLPRAVK